MKEKQAKQLLGITQKEIDSHSSGLTNLKISRILDKVIESGYEATTAFPPSIQSAIAYHGWVLELFMETTSLYYGLDEEKSKEIDRLIVRGEKFVYVLQINPKSPQLFVIELIQNSKRLRYLMHNMLQRMNFFFRIGVREPKGIAETLELFKSKKDGNKISGHERELQEIPDKQDIIDAE